MAEFKVIVPKNVDTVFYWESETDRQPIKCRLRIYWITWEKAVVIVTDLFDSPGSKIANATKELIHFTSHIYDLALCKIMLVEHYSVNNLSDEVEDTYRQVVVVNDEVIRYEIDRSKLIELTGRYI